MKYSKEFKLQLGLTETATDADVDARLGDLQAAENRARTLESELATERTERQRADADRAKAEVDTARAVANARVDAWERDGKISGNATKAVRALYVAASAGEKIAPEMVAATVEALPKLDTARIAEDAKPPATHSDVSLDDFTKSGSDAAASKRISAAVAERKKSDPKFTAAKLERELRGTAAR